MLRQQLAAAVIAGATVWMGVSADTPAQPAGLGGAIHRGACESPAERVADLAPSALPQGSPRGNADAIPATSSFSSFAVPFDDLIAEEHVVVATEPGGEVVACGAIGGIRNESGALVVGLSPASKSGVTGIAYIVAGADPASTDLSLFVAGDALAGFAPEALDAVADEASEGIVAGGGVEVLLTPLPAAEPGPAAPTAVPQSAGFTPAEQAYADDVVRITGTMQDSFADLVELTENPRFGQDDWTIAVVLQFAIWDASYEEALALDPPPAFADTHALFVDALRLYSEAGRDFALGMDTLDMAVIDGAVAKMAQGDALIDAAGAEVDAILAARGG